MEYFKFLYSTSPSLKINLTSNGHKTYKYITKDNNTNEYPHIMIMKKFQVMSNSN